MGITRQRRLHGVRYTLWIGNGWNMIIPITKNGEVGSSSFVNSGEHAKIYASTEAGKILKKKCDKAYMQTEIGKANHNKNSRKYGKTEKGHINGLKHINKRKRNYGFEIVYPKPEDGNEWEWNHIDYNRVVPMLKDIHSHFYHSSPWFFGEGVLG